MREVVRLCICPMRRVPAFEIFNSYLTMTAPMFAGVVIERMNAITVNVATYVVPSIRMTIEVTIVMGCVRFLRKR
ncbi:hypothetical protein JOM56_004345 [Amanita muscaria]